MLILNVLTPVSLCWLRGTGSTRPWTRLPSGSICTEAARGSQLLRAPSRIPLVLRLWRLSRASSYPQMPCFSSLTFGFSRGGSLGCSTQILVTGWRACPQLLCMLVTDSSAVSFSGNFSRANGSPLIPRCLGYSHPTPQEVGKAND